MNKVIRLVGLTGAALLIATPSHAGLASFINDVFTFREDQKDLVRPNYQLPPKHVLIPHYNERAAQEWSAYYTREDLEAQAGMDDSVMVMRPAARDHRVRAGRGAGQEVGHTHYQHYPQRFSGNSDQLGMPHGFEAIQRRDHLNRTAGNGNVYIGEAGSGPHLAFNGGGQVGQKTIVGNPKSRWDDTAPRDGFAVSRPGDFDYNQPHYGDPRPAAPQPQQLTRASGYGEPVVMLNDGGVDMTASVHHAGKPTRYTVTPNDTLSGISGQQQIYGDWKLWPMIYDANRDQIDDPDLIHPGQDLGIPRDYTRADQQDARSRANAKYRSGNYSFFDGQ